MPRSGPPGLQGPPGNLRGPFSSGNIPISSDGLLLVTPDSPVNGDGRNNVAIGDGALALTTSGNATVAIGINAGQKFGSAEDVVLGSGRSSVFVGHVAGQYVTSGYSNTFIGAYAGRGYEINGATGADISGTHPLIGGDNTMVGEATGIRIKGQARNNNGIGFNALFGLDYAWSNCAFGVASGYALTGGSDGDASTQDQNSLYGHISYEYGKGRQNVAIGAASMAGKTYTAVNTQVTHVGDNVIFLDDVTNFQVGGRVYQGGTIPMDCTITAKNPGANSITIDRVVFNAIPTGFTWISVPNPHTGRVNVAVGFNALGDLQGAADYNIGIGSAAAVGINGGDDNIAIGRSTAATLTTGSLNILIGTLVDVPAADSTQCMNVGNTIFGTGVNGSVVAPGKIGFGTNAPTSRVDINDDRVRIRTAKTPASAAAIGNAGDFCWDASFFYICVATNTWRRVAHASW